MCSRMANLLLITLTVLSIYCQHATATVAGYYQSGVANPYGTKWLSRQCQGQTMELNCEAGRIRTITNIFWGRVNENSCTGEGLDTSATSCSAQVNLFSAFQHCQYSPTCSIDVTTDALDSDPCPGIYKVLEVEYTCDLPVNYAFTCEADGLLELSCPNDNEVMKVYGGFYGYKYPSPCGTEDETCEGASDIGEKIGAICDGQNYCEMTVNNAYLGDPGCQGATYINANFVCEVCENKYIDDEKCKEWAETDHCDSNAEWMNTNCRKACWGCGIDYESMPGCVNIDDQCPYWVSRGECFINPGWMSVNCALACRTCEPVVEEQFEAEEGVDYFATVCEGEWVNTNCGTDEDLKLRITDVFFGRMDNTTCQHSSIETINCPSLDSTVERAQTLCNGRNQCFLGADNWQFEDPCPGTYKYISLEHTCQKCENELTDSTCADLADQGRCDSDQEYMLDMCFASCTGCDYAECDNIYESDKDCDRWSGAGECSVNPDMMKEQCKESCRECQPNTDNSCINWYGTSNCEGWANDGQCDKNPYWMRDNCQKACDKCDEDCVNYNLNCVYWESIGECNDNPGYMNYYCPKACGQCQAATAPACHNALDADYLCTTWAADGACSINPDFMNVSCEKACGLC